MSDMNCDDCATWVHPYLDNELDAATAALVGAHLERCPTCRAKFDEMGALRNGIRQHLPYHAAPAALRRQVLAQLRPHRPVRETAHGQGWLRWLAPAFSTVALTLAVLVYVAAPSPRDRLADELVSSHVRSLMEQHLTDVASSDRHTVKPWFTGKLDFSPPVVDFAQQGYPLVGGRLDYVAHRTVAALVYRHGKHVINVFVMPTTETDTGLQTGSRRGFNVVSWRRHHLAYVAVSDLSPDELRELGRLIENHP